MKAEELLSYVDARLKNGDYQVRFELGEPYENGTDERIKQVVSRAVTLFEETFLLGETIDILIKDWLDIDAGLGDTATEYIYDLLKNLNMSTIIYTNVTEDIDPQGKPFKCEQKLRATAVSAPLLQAAYTSILEGIANYEQGRSPAVRQDVFFISLKRGILFYMYDDRGCLVVSATNELPKHLYRKYNEWLDNFYRAGFDALYQN